MLCCYRLGYAALNQGSGHVNDTALPGMDLKPQFLLNLQASYACTDQKEKKCLCRETFQPCHDVITVDGRP